jgi:hypothetical protein
MEKIIIETRQIPVKDEYDLIVCGGGVAGIATALAGVRQGLKTMLAEKSTMLGGLGTLGLINWYEPLCDGEGRVMTTGIAEELLLLSITHGYDNLEDQWKNRSSESTPEFSVDVKNPRYATHFNPSVFTLALNDLIFREGIELRYDLLASYPVMEGPHCSGIIAESSAGREFFPAKVVVDATGDAVIASLAGIPCRDGINYLTYVGHGCTQDSIKKALETGDMVNLNDHRFWCGSDLNGKGHPEGLHTFVGIKNEERSEFIRLGQNLLFEKVKIKAKNEACLFALPGMAQLRKTRCIIGKEIFSAEDGKHCDTSIGVAGDFRRPGRHFEFPLGMIFNENFPNLLAAGRIASAEGDGWEIARVIPSTALTGEAAGVAASLMVKQKKGINELNIEEMQKLLIKNNVNLHF